LAINEKWSSALKKILEGEYSVGFLWFSVYYSIDSSLQQNASSSTIKFVVTGFHVGVLLE